MNTPINGLFSAEPACLSAGRRVNVLGTKIVLRRGNSRCTREAASFAVLHHSAALGPVVPNASGAAPSSPVS